MLKIVHCPCIRHWPCLCVMFDWIEIQFRSASIIFLCSDLAVYVNAVKSDQAIIRIIRLHINKICN